MRFLSHVFRDHITPYFWQWCKEGTLKSIIIGGMAPHFFLYLTIGGKYLFRVYTRVSTKKKEESIPGH